jgi:uncharacterized integral membrane protein
MAASSNLPLNVVFLVVAIMGPVVAIAIFWFGLRSARKHDEQNRS